MFSAFLDDSSKSVLQILQKTPICCRPPWTGLRLGDSEAPAGGHSRHRLVAIVEFQAGTRSQSPSQISGKISEIRSDSAAIKADGS